MTDLEKLVEMIKNARKNNLSVSIAYLGNIVDVWERIALEKELIVDLGSD